MEVSRARFPSGAITGDVADTEKFLQALRTVEVPDDPRGPMELDELGNPIQNVSSRTVERVCGSPQNTVTHTDPMLSQFCTSRKDDYLKLPLSERNDPPGTSRD